MESTCVMSTANTSALVLGSLLLLLLLALLPEPMPASGFI
jgi:hypothetical protein